MRLSTTTTRRRRSIDASSSSYSSFSVEALQRHHQVLLQLCLNSFNNNSEIQTTTAANNNHQESSSSSPTRLRRRSAVQQLFLLGDGTGKNNSNNTETTTTINKMDLTLAFRDVGGAVDVDDDDDKDTSRDDVVDAPSLEAREKLINEAIQAIGIILVQNADPTTRSSSPKTAGTTTLRSDEIFEYFCEAALLHLLVDVACQKPNSSNKNNHNPKQQYHGIVWSPVIKTQIVRTITLLIHGLVPDASALYYLLSRNCINQLILTVLPWQQWTDPAVTLLLPAYLELLQSLTLQLSASPHLFPFYLLADNNNNNSNNNNNYSTCPLFTATLETAVYAYRRSDSFAHATCLTMLVDLLRIPPVQTYVATQSHVPIAHHLATLLLDRFDRLVRLCHGPVVHNGRSQMIAEQDDNLQDQIQVLNDIFNSNSSSSTKLLQGLHVRLCETLLQRLVRVLLSSLINEQRSFLHVIGVQDVDVIPDDEARAQAAVFVLARLFGYIDYPPLIRMLAVAVWHVHTIDWTCMGDHDDNNNNNNHGGASSTTSTTSYVLVPRLNAIAQNRSAMGKDVSSTNPYRQEILKALRGDCGEYRFVVAAMLVEVVLQASPSLDHSTLVMLGVLSGNQGTDTVEDALAEFLRRSHELKSSVSIMAMECAASVAVHLIHKHWMSSAERNGNTRTPLMDALVQCRDYFFRQTLDSHRVVGVSDLLADLMEAAVTRRYRRTTLPVRGTAGGPAVYAFLLSQHGCASYVSNPEVMIRKMRGVDCNDVEATRFFVDMALVLRACCRLVDRMQTYHENDPAARLPAFQTLMDKADDLAGIFGGLRDKPERGTDLDLRGRMYFPFATVKKAAKQSKSPESEKPTMGGRQRTLSDEIILRSTTTLLLVLDPTDMFIVKPTRSRDATRGTVVCGIPLLEVIAAAADEAWLHVAVRHHDVGFLIKNGNMALEFESAGTCLIVRQYLERCRQVLRSELVEKIKAIFRAVPAEQPSTQEVEQRPGDYVEKTVEDSE